MSAFVLKIRFLSAVQNCCLSIFLHLPHAGCRWKEHQVKQMRMCDQFQSFTLKHLLKIEATTYFFQAGEMLPLQRSWGKKTPQPHSCLAFSTVNTTRIFQRLRGSTKSLSCNKCMNTERHNTSELHWHWSGLHLLTYSRINQNELGGMKQVPGC